MLQIVAPPSGDAFRMDAREPRVRHTDVEPLGQVTSDPAPEFPTVTGQINNPNRWSESVVPLETGALRGMELPTRSFGGTFWV